LKTIMKYAKILFKVLSFLRGVLKAFVGNS